MKNVEFYFDFGSPYSYLAYHQLKKIAEQTQANIVYKPIILGGIFKATGNNSPISIAAKARYSFQDILRWGKFWHIPLNFNPHFPINSFFLMRAAVGYQQLDPRKFERFVEVMFKAMFEQPENLNDEQVIKALLEKNGLAFEEYQSLINQDDVKQLAKDLTQQAVDKGLFGVPAFIVDDELYWGQDRLHFVETALSQ